MQSEKIRNELISGEARARQIRFSNHKKYYQNAKKQSDNFKKLLSVLNDSGFASYEFLNEDFDFNENIKLMKILNSNCFQLYDF